MALDLTVTRISNAEKQEIVDKSPEAVLPLNPTAQGWTGQAIRKQLSSYVTDDQSSVLSLMQEKFDNVSNTLANLEGFSQNGLDVLEVVYDEAISKGDLVQFAGVDATNGKLKVKKTINTGTGNIQEKIENILGIALSNGVQTDIKEILFRGMYVGLDTSGYTEGGYLYADPVNSGQIVNTEPSPPKNRTVLGIVVYSHASAGVIFFRPSFVPKLAQIQDIDLTGVSEGDTLVYKETSQKFEAQRAIQVHLSTSTPTQSDGLDGEFWVEYED